MKFLISLFLAFIAMLVSPFMAFAEEVTTCVTQYGGGVVCGVTTPHIPVKAGLADINPLYFSTFLLLASTLFFLLSRYSQKNGRI